MSFVSLASKQVLFSFKRRSLISAAPEAVEIKLINKYVNEDLKNLSNQLKVNKICLNVSKTEVALFKIFKSKKNKLIVA